ncbi:DNA helicase [Acanthamoeba castellanii medusavirus]|uniref:DNA helicase n=1 Tax=Acanthamoeba castellanii medusavirus J1 TaxID=3114988 RepID=A0A3T1CXK1_9VIRU|nr:DNA helicase [Acanthamoeba castellanii medusavirus]BBI30515.1 DNA helicase [Acanthamoeba castellanii medusavirus J1]
MQIDQDVRTCVDLTAEEEDNSVIPIYDQGVGVVGPRLDAVHREMSTVLAHGVRLKDQQARAIPWLTMREETDHLGCRGGLNFDAPGTGKTLLFVSLITLQKYRQDSQTSDSNWWRRATLVVAPSVVVAEVWIQEMKTRIARERRPSVLLYHGTGRARQYQAAMSAGTGWDVVVTTYGVLTAEHKKAIAGLSKVEREVAPLEEKSPLFYNYHRVILDEAHQGRNAGTRLSRALLALKGDVRWVISATPVFNSLEDLVMPLRFLGVRPYADGSAEFKADIMNLAAKNRKSALKRLHAILAPIAIRRNNDDLGLPPIRYKEVVLTPSDTQKAFCDALRSYCGVRVKDLLKMAAEGHREGGGRTYNRRPQAAGRKRGWSPNYNMSVLALITYVREAVCHPALVINSMKRLADIRGIKDDGDGDESEQKPTDTITQEQMLKAIERLRTLSTDEGREDECCICMDAEATLLASPCGHGCCAACWDRIEYHSRGDGPTCPQCRQPVTSTAPRAELIKCMEAEIAPAPPVEAMDVPEETWDDSCKIDYVVSKVRKHASREKIVIVSQWVRLLRVVSDKMLAEGVLEDEAQLVRLQGDVSGEKRIESINRFQRDEDVRVCFLSLNSSSDGITLTAATRMYVLDPWWNASRDYQAVHRIHRIGQTRPVKIMAVYVGQTVEDQMRIIRASKGAIACATVGDGAPPEEFDWTTEAKLIFDIDDVGAGSRKRKLPPTCSLPGCVATDKQVAKGFDAQWRQDVLAESASITKRTHDRKQRTLTAGARMTKRQKRESDEKQSVEDVNSEIDAMLFVYETQQQQDVEPLLPPPSTMSDAEYSAALDELNDLVSIHPLFAELLAPSDSVALSQRRAVITID